VIAPGQVNVHRATSAPPQFRHNRLLAIIMAGG